MKVYGYPKFFFVWYQSIFLHKKANKCLKTDILRTTHTSIDTENIKRAKSGLENLHVLFYYTWTFLQALTTQLKYAINLH